MLQRTHSHSLSFVFLRVCVWGGEQCPVVSEFIPVSMFKDHSCRVGCQSLNWVQPHVRHHCFPRAVSLVPMYVVWSELVILSHTST